MPEVGRRIPLRVLDANGEFRGGARHGQRPCQNVQGNGPKTGRQPQQNHSRSRQIDFFDDEEENLDDSQTQPPDSTVFFRGESDVPVDVASVPSSPSTPVTIPATAGIIDRTCRNFRPPLQVAEVGGIGPQRRGFAPFVSTRSIECTPPTVVGRNGASAQRLVEARANIADKRFDVRSRQHSPLEEATNENIDDSQRQPGNEENFLQFSNDLVRRPSNTIQGRVTLRTTHNSRNDEEDNVVDENLDDSETQPPDDAFFFHSPNDWQVQVSRTACTPTTPLSSPVFRSNNNRVSGVSPSYFEVTDRGKSVSRGLTNTSLHRVVGNRRSASADNTSLASNLGLSSEQFEHLLQLAKSCGGDSMSASEGRLLPVTRGDNHQDTVVPETEPCMQISDMEMDVRGQQELTHGNGGSTHHILQHSVADDLGYDSFEEEVPLIQLKRQKMVDPSIDDVEPFLRAGEVTVPGDSSLNKRGLTLLDDGVPRETEHFCRTLRSAMSRCMPDCSKSWHDESNREGVRAVIAEMEAEFGKGFSRKWLRKKMAKLQGNRRSYQRRLAAMQRKPDYVPQEVMKAHQEYLSRKKPEDSSQQRQARAKQYRVSKLGSGGISSLRNKVVDAFGFVPDQRHIEFAKRHGPAMLMAVLHRKGYPRRDKSMSVDEIFLKDLRKKQLQIDR